MSTDPNAARAAPDPSAEGRPGRGGAYRDNQQRLDQGVAVMGGIGGDLTVITGTHFDEAVTDEILKPRLREGPYPADDVHTRLRGFVEPPTYTQCRKTLDSRLLVLRARGSSGASTTAFALLAERHGAHGMTGLDSSEDLARWRPREARGYLLQGLPSETADSLGEVGLTALADLLRRSGAHLVITVRAEVALPRDTIPWQVVHRPPPSADVAAELLGAMARAGEITPEQGTEALGHLGSADFAGHLRSHPLPQDGVEVAQGLRDLVTSGKPSTSVLDELQAGSLAAARRALAEAGHRADGLSLMAAISLLAGQDRTVVEEFSATLRPLIEERGGQATVGQEPPARRDLLGPAFEDRLEAVGARLLPARSTAARRYPVQPVVFSGRHRSDALLRCLWLDYEGMGPLLWKALDEAPRHSGIDLAAGRAIGRALAHATGPNTLRQLMPFAASDTRWRRRLVAYALGEMAQRPSLTGSVREQLRHWSRAVPVPLRCTVAETCAGSYGLAHPATALNLLDSALDRLEKDLDRGLRAAVSFALSVLLSEKTNHALVLDRLRSWQTAGPGTQHHAMAVYVIDSMSRTTFPPAGAPGLERLRLADLLAEHFDRAFDLVVTALNDPATYEVTAECLSLIESDPHMSRRTTFPRLLGALFGTARSHRGVMRFVLGRHRANAFPPAEGVVS
ncbi:hypothetical protein ABT001_06640 [Streptomyces sp. NPDC002793]|uniref:hypothetical protein n=1 Tax=Streptomyces sp. NPDC002793 TaxID=3154432 RepID=UPI0033341422